MQGISLRLCKEFFWFHSGIIRCMKLRTLRRMLAVILLLASLVLLAWGLWPELVQSIELPISPSDMQLPTPSGWIPALYWLG